MCETVKRGIGALALLGLMALLLWHNGLVGQAVEAGLRLCGRSVLPALFPFFVTVSFAVACGVFDTLRRLGLPVGAAVFLLGIVGGYPVGGRTVGQLRRAGALSKEAAETLLTCCNNAGPAFILSIAGETVFGSRRAGLALYAIHAVAALAVGWLMGALRRREAPHRKAPEDNVPVSLPSAFVTSVGSAALAMVSVCAFVIFFLAVTALLRQLCPGLPPSVWGLLELTGGILALENTPGGFCMAAALLGWGGLSVHCQTAAVLEGTGLAMGRYLLAKALHGALSALLALAVYRLLW